MARSDAPSSSSQFLPLIASVCAIAALYFARELLVTIALAALITFLLTPLAGRLEGWGLGRFPSVVLVLVFTLSTIGSVGWILSKQLIDVVNELPNYKDNIHRKLESIQGSKGGVLDTVTGTVQDLGKELATNPPNQPRTAPLVPARSSKAAPSPTNATPRPTPVEIIEPPPNALQSVRDFLGPLVRPLGTALMVIVFTVFMLINREDLRNRLIRLVSRGHLNRMTEAMDDAGRRVTRYLLMQLLVNFVFAALVAIGLFFIGVPYALLWGALAGSLRFIPYLGILAGASLPLLLSLAVCDGWTQPLLTLGLFLVIELCTANVVEPWLYASHTGISPLAILVAAVFWTVLWGPVGLILSTPLTVCLLVLGRHVPQLEFLHILLGDEPVLAPEAQFYQRLLAMDQQEARTVIDACLKEKPLIDLYDEVIVPALAMAEEDRRRDTLDESKEAFIVQSINQFLAELADNPPAPLERPDEAMKGSQTDSRVICLPAKDQADETTAAMLAQLLEQAGYPARSFAVSDSPIEILEGISRPSDVVFICALPPFALINARTLSKRLRTRFPDMKVMVGLWNYSGGGARIQERLGRAFVDTVVTTLRQALEEIHHLNHPEPVETSLEPANQ